VEFDLAHVRRSGPRLLSATQTQVAIHFFQRSKKSGEGITKPCRMPPSLAEIARAKLIRHRDRRRAHGPIFVRALRPSDTLRLVDP
jgi:hypothetical protein